MLLTERVRLANEINGIVADALTEDDNFRLPRSYVLALTLCAVDQALNFPEGGEYEDFKRQILEAIRPRTEGARA